MQRASLVLAAAVVLAGALVLNRVMSTLGMPWLGQVSAGAVLIGIKRVDRYIQRFLARKRPTRPQIEGYEGFGLPWYTMLVYGTFVFAAALEVSSFFGGLSIGASGGDFADLQAVLVVDLVIGGSAALFFIGAWLGSRCIRFGIPVLFGIVILGRGTVGLIDYMALSPSQYEEVLGVDKSLSSFALGALIGAVLFSLLAAIFGLVGFWRGRRTRLANYLQFLLAQVSDETRRTIVSLAYEEAQRVEEQEVPTPPATARAVPA